jgi:hypothetical protein
MKEIIKIQTEIEAATTPSTPFTCPYCSAVTVINRIMTEPGCQHFDDSILFKRDKDSFSEIDEPTDKVEFIEATFRLSGSTHRRIEKEKIGELVDTDEGMKLMENGKFEGYVSPDEFADMFLGDDEDDVEYRRGD